MIAAGHHRGRALRLVLAAIFVAAAVAAAASPAHAFTVRPQGAPGSIQVPKLWGAILFTPYRGPSDIFDLNEFAREHGGGNDFVAYFPQRYAWRSNAYAGAQLVTVLYRSFLENWCHTWEPNCSEHSTLHRTDTESVSIPAGTSGAWVRDFATKLDPNYELGITQGVPFGGDVVVTWRAADGRYLGRKIVDYAVAGDYGCLTAYCQVSHSDRLGAYITEYQNA
jgi:hypothetical protein